MANLSLYFSGVTNFELVKTDFFSPLLLERIKSIRGKDSFKDSGSFQWTQGVQALTILFLRTKISKISDGSIASYLSGLKGTPASSLDYTLSKPPAWMFEMFGCLSSGEPLVRRLIKRVNPEQKLPGPVIVSVNESFLNPDRIKIFLNDFECSDVKLLLTLLTSIELQWRPARVSTQSQIIQNQISQSAFDNLVPQIKLSYERELSFILRNTEVFTRKGIKGVVQRMLSDVSIAGLNSKAQEELFSKMGEQSPLSKERYGIISSMGALFSDLKVACPLGSPSALAIFNHLKLKHSFEIDFTYQHALELMYAIVKNQLNYTPDLIVLGTAPAALFLPISKSLGYHPFMILPGMTHRVLKSGRKVKKKKEFLKGPTNFLMLNTDPSTSVMYFKRLKAEQKFQSRLSKITHAEPDEIFSQLASGEEDVRSVLYYPYYEMNRIFNGSELIDSPSDNGNIKDSMLFIHESLFSDLARTRVLQQEIKNSWLTLREQPGEVTRTISSLFEQPEFTTFLSRSSGLFQLN